jgi:hypothetical protein
MGYSFPQVSTTWRNPLANSINTKVWYNIMVANNTRSRKSKGFGFQREIKELLMEHFGDKLEEGDIRSTSSGVSGIDLQLSPAAQKLFPFACELKRCEKVSLRQWWKQAKTNSTDKLKPLLITKQNREETLVVMDMDTFLGLL